MTRRTYQTSKQQLLADRFATVVFTVTGVAVIAAVLGMLIFFVATVVPLFVPVNFEVLRQKTLNAELVSFVRDPDSPFLGEVLTNDTGQCVLETSISLPTSSGAGAGAGAEPDSKKSVSLGAFRVTWPQGESPRLVRFDPNRAAGTSQAAQAWEAGQSEPFLCFGTDSSKLLLISRARAALVQLSADREFLRREEISKWKPALQEQLRQNRWLADRGNLYAQASDVAPAARVYASLNTVLLFEDHAPELFAKLAQAFGKTKVRFIAGTENRSLLLVSAHVPSVSTPELRSSVPEPQQGFKGAQDLGLDKEGMLNIALLAQTKENLMTGSNETSTRWVEQPQDALSTSLAGSGATIVVAMADGTVRFVDWSMAWENGLSQWRSLPTNYEGRVVAAGVSFGLNTLLLIGEDAKCRAYDIGFYALQRTGASSDFHQDFMKPRFERDCLMGTIVGNQKFDSKAVNLISHPTRRLAFLVTPDFVITGIDLTTGENIVRVSLQQVATELQFASSSNGLSDIELGFEKTGEFAVLLKKQASTMAQGIAFSELIEMRLHAENIEGSLSRMFRKIHYESYSAPSYSWQSASASNDFEAKFSLMPLLWGTLKATFYAMLFAGPLGILAAVYSSEILDRRTRNFVKPAIEMMASLPSVVLGFLAAIVLAPWIESNILGVILCGLVLPFCLYFFGNLVSQYSARHVSGRGLYASRRLLIAIFIGFLVAFFALLRLGHVVEHFAFAGDIKAFLAGGSGSSGVLYGILVLPLVLLGLWSLPWIPSGKATKYWRTAVFLFGPFMSLALGAFLQTHFGETHLSIAGYSQRNALVICVAMGFAIIPIIYSLSEDAFTSVPGSLRAGSLACGASVWQTTARVILPTAASGVFSAVMIGFGRAIGETMIVVMAAGNSPIMSLNPFDGLRTLSANIAVELPEAPMGGTHYRILFFSGMALFMLTFVMNTAAEVMRTKYRKRNKAL